MCHRVSRTRLCSMFSFSDGGRRETQRRIKNTFYSISNRTSTTVHICDESKKKGAMRRFFPGLANSELAFTENLLLDELKKKEERVLANSLHRRESGCAPFISRTPVPPRFLSLSFRCGGVTHCTALTRLLHTKAEGGSCNLNSSTFAYQQVWQERGCVSLVFCDGLFVTSLNCPLTAHSS